MYQQLLDFDIFIETKLTDLHISKNITAKTSGIFCLKVILNIQFQTGNQTDFSLFPNYSSLAAVVRFHIWQHCHFGSKDTQRSYICFFHRSENVNVACQVLGLSQIPLAGLLNNHLLAMA